MLRGAEIPFAHAVSDVAVSVALTEAMTISAQARRGNAIQDRRRAPVLDVRLGLAPVVELVTQGGGDLLVAEPLLDAAGDHVGPGGTALLDLERIDLRPLVELVGDDVSFVVASDVDNPLCGPAGQ